MSSRWPSIPAPDGETLRIFLSQSVYVLAVATAVYAVVTVVAFLAADAIMFQPPRSSYSDNAGILKLETVAGELISAVYLPNDTARFTILHSHGNAEDLGQLLPLLGVIRDQGYAVLAYDYPGYGTSRGRPSAAGAMRAIDAAYGHLTDELGVAPDRIIVYGRSVGSGPTLELADRRPVAGVILESAFTSAYRVLTRYPLLAFDRFPNLRRIRELETPVLVIHGTADRVIPFSHGRALFDAAPGPKMQLWVEGAGHNDLLAVARHRWTRALREFAEALEAAE